MGRKFLGYAKSTVGANNDNDDRSVFPFLLQPLFVRQLCVDNTTVHTHVLHMMCTQPFRASSNLQPFHLPHTYPHCHDDDVDDDFDGDVLTTMTIDHLCLTFRALL